MSKVKSKKKIAAAALAFIMAIMLVAGLVPQQTYAASAADAATNDDWYGYLRNDTREVGRIWTDKTVSDNEITFPKFENGVDDLSIDKGDSDFIVSFAALSSTATIKGKAKDITPLDIVLVLDTSGSMADSIDNKYTKVYENELDTDEIYYFMKDNEYREVYYKINSWYYKDNWGNDKKVFPKTSESDKTNNHVQFYSTTTKLEALQTAVNGFIDDTAEANSNISDADKKHRVSIVEFKTSETYNDKLHEYPDKSDVLLNDKGDNGWITCEGDSNINNLKGAVNGLQAYGATPADTGMTLAQAQINKINEDRNSKKVVIFFTDGEPNHSRDFDSTVANATIKQAKELKDKKVTIYSIGVFKDADPSDPTGNFNAYMHGVSSNYPDATAYTNLGTRAENSDFYKAATNADELSEIFGKIAADITTQPAESPTEVQEGNNGDTDGYITYVDETGEYMQVDDVKGVVFNGAIYEPIEENPTPVINSNTGIATYTYSFEGEVGNEIYPGGNLNQLIVKVERDTRNLEQGDIITVQVPASLISLIHFNIELDADGKAKTTVDKVRPGAIAYGVSLKPEAEAALENPDETLTEYIANNTDDDGQVVFYSNIFDKTEAESNVYSTFNPNNTNDFYYFQEDTVLYTDEDCTEPATGVIDTSGDTIYYYQRTYYEVSSPDGNGNPVAAAPKINTVRIPGDSNLLLSGYAELNAKNQRYIPAGTPRTTSVYGFEKLKDNNITNTESYVIEPTWVDVKNSPTTVKNYLGNNGIMSVDIPGSLEVTKKVTADAGLKAPDGEFTFKLDLTAKSGSSLKANGYNAQIFNKDGTKSGSLITVIDNGTFKLKDGQKIIVYGLEEGTKYQVTEPEQNLPDGFANTNATGTSGTIADNTKSTASFTNNYSVQPAAVTPADLGLYGVKKIEGRDFKSGDEFKFVINPVEGEASNPLPSPASATINPSSGKEAVFNFGNIEFDKPGTYSYVIYEEHPETGEGGNAVNAVPGVSYDSSIYRFTVQINDDGDGTLSAGNIKIEKQAAGSTGWISVYEGEVPVYEQPINPNNVKIVFTNEYEAQSENISIHGKKIFTGKSLTGYNDGEQFKFQLTAAGSRAVGTDGAFAADSSQPMPADKGSDSKYVYRNSSTGELVIPEITYTKNDIGKEYKYVITELQPTDTGAYDGKPLDGAVKNGTGQWVYRGVTFDNSGPLSS